MLVIKRDNTKQKMDIYKIRTSIENAANDCDYPLVSSNVNILVKEVTKKIKKRNEVSSREIKMIIYEVLREYKFDKVAISYLEGI